uniref:SHSP domain-containing protein n=1 Tax=Bursaphelenchus xylophilus TaxID=6326 RepID=A0A1I7S2T6_BURXY
MPKIRCNNLQMIDCAQIRLETLRTYVRAPFPKTADLIQPDAKPVDAHFEDGCAVMSLQAQKRTQEHGRFTVTPVKEPASTAYETFDHLSVECSGSAAEKRSLLTVSPADSTDSGVPPSPCAYEEDTLSPLPGPLPRFDFKATQHSGPVNAPKFRARSASECLDVRRFASNQLGRQNSVNSSNGR